MKGFWGDGELSPLHREILKKNLFPGAVALDVGANIGDYSLYMARLGARVYAFEPGRIFWKLDKRCGERIVRYNIALLNEEGMRLFYDRHCSALASFDGTGKTVYPVATQRLDSFHLKPDFIKIDVEGFEGEVIDGAMETIRRYRPRLFVEAKNSEAIKKLMRLGYSCTRIDKENYLFGSL